MVHDNEEFPISKEIAITHVARMKHERACVTLPTCGTLLCSPHTRPGRPSFPSPPLLLALSSLRFVFVHCLFDGYVRSYRVSFHVASMEEDLYKDGDLYLPAYGFAPKKKSLYASSEKCGTTSNPATEKKSIRKKCLCGKCKENSASLCCIYRKWPLFTGHPSVKCFTDTEECKESVLNKHALRLTHHLETGTREPPEPRTYRFLAYKATIGWFYPTSLGKGRRIPLPSCIEEAIHGTFPSDSVYTGFQESSMQRTGLLPPPEEVPELREDSPESSGEDSTSSEDTHLPPPTE
ncbi:unnamed protein product [Cyprideis torosa]|uniref:Uncharacterized protein n=1 Tax=Cyprideis torosa TaxID=163714 RepID=A0A7R8ZS08_9CRUS|nr:unnamed protein product [Cyprideis torosa]CAG0895178.1 unnamed protein product [Cyprideis torosa]